MCMTSGTSNRPARDRSSPCRRRSDRRKLHDGARLPGNAYASQGPLVYPEILFGSEVLQPAGEAMTLKYTLQSVAGLQSVKLIERGVEIDSRAFDSVRAEVPVEFTVRPKKNTWYSLVIEDVNSKVAYTNPVWVTVEGESRWH